MLLHRHRHPMMKKKDEGPGERLGELFPGRTRDSAGSCTMLEGEGGGVGGKEGRKEGGSSMLAHRLLCGCANCKGSQPSGFESGPVIAKGG